MFIKGILNAFHHNEEREWVDVEDMLRWGMNILVDLERYFSVNMIGNQVKDIQTKWASVIRKNERAFSNKVSSRSQTSHPPQVCLLLPPTLSNLHYDLICTVLESQYDVNIVNRFEISGSNKLCVVLDSHSQVASIFSSPINEFLVKRNLVKIVPMELYPVILSGVPKGRGVEYVKKLLDDALDIRPASININEKNGNIELQLISPEDLKIVKEGAVHLQMQIVKPKVEILFTFASPLPSTIFFFTAWTKYFGFPINSKSKYVTFHPKMISATVFLVQGHYETVKQIISQKPFEISGKKVIVSEVSQDLLTSISTPTPTPTTQVTPIKAQSAAKEEKGENLGEKANLQSRTEKIVKVSSVSALEGDFLRKFFVPSLPKASDTTLEIVGSEIIIKGKNENHVKELKCVVTETRKKINVSCPTIIIDKKLVSTISEDLASALDDVACFCCSLRSPDLKQNKDHWNKFSCIVDVTILYYNDPVIVDRVKKSLDLIQPMVEEINYTAKTAPFIFDVLGNLFKAYGVVYFHNVWKKSLKIHGLKVRVELAKNYLDLHNKVK